MKNYYFPKGIVTCLIGALLMLGAGVLYAQERPLDEEEGASWIHPIDEVNVVNKRLVVGDLVIALVPGFTVRNPQGQRLNHSVLESGVLISVTPEYRNNRAYVDAIVVLE